MRRTNEEKFRTLWERMAEIGAGPKVIVWKELRLGKDLVRAACPACNEAVKRRIKLAEYRDMCECCPIEWPRGRTCARGGSLWLQWLYSVSTKSKRMELAKKISRLPWRDEGEVVKG